MKDRMIFMVSPEGEFFGREDVIEGIYQKATSPGATSIYMCGGGRIGKTEVLKRVYHRLFWGQTDVVPIYYAMKGDYETLSGFAEDYLGAVIRQYIAFLKKDPLLVIEGLPLTGLKDVVVEEELIGLLRLISIHREARDNKDYTTLIRNAITAPHLISLYHQTRVFVMLDDFHLIKGLSTHEGGLLDEYTEVLRSRFAPHLITGSTPEMLKGIFKGGLLDAVDVIEIKGLDNAQALSMLEGLCHLYHIKYDKDVISIAVRQLSGNPFYIKAIVKAAQRLGVELTSLKGFMGIYAHELIEGGIGFYLASRLSTLSNGKDRAATLRLLRIYLNLGGCVSTDILAERTGLRGCNLSDLLERLRQMGVAEGGYGMAKGVKDEVLVDFVEAIYGMEVKGRSPEEVKTYIIKDRLKEGFRLQGFEARGELKGQVKGLLGRFNGQRVPKVLFRNHDFLARFRGGDTEKIERLEEEDNILLPQIVGCFEGKGGYIRRDLYIIIGHGFYDGRYEEGSELIWMVGVKGSLAVVDTEDVEEFIDSCNLLKDKVKTAGMVRWIIGKGGFTGDALKKMGGEGIFSSDMTQFHLLRRFVEEGEVHRSLRGLMPLKEFELVIPMAQEVELVAARTVEEIARKVGFDDDAVGQIKMALVEACINAFEHSKVRDGKVMLRFFVEGDRLVVHVQNEGRSFDPATISRPDIEAKIMGPHRRGWGIELMKGLMDEVRFERVEGGTRLVMVKYIKGGRDGYQDR